MKSVLAFVTAALALSASSAFAQSQPAPATAPVVKAAPAAGAQVSSDTKLTEIDAKMFPGVRTSVLSAIDDRINLLQSDRKCVAAATDGKALEACKKASNDAQRAMVEKLMRSQGRPGVPSIVGVPPAHGPQGQPQAAPRH